MKIAEGRGELETAAELQPFLARGTRRGMAGGATALPENHLAANGVAGPCGGDNRPVETDGAGDEPEGHCGEQREDKRRGKPRPHRWLSLS